MHERLKLIQWLNKVNGGHEFCKHETVFFLTVLSFIEIDPELVQSFIHAAWYGDVSKVVDMVEAGMPVDILDEDGWTALMTAACNNRTDVVRYLLANGANVNKQNRFGETALHDASINNHTDVISVLLQHGASRDIKSNDGRTPIDYARVWNQKEAVDLLEQY